MNEGLTGLERKEGELINDNIFIFGRTIPLRKVCVYIFIAYMYVIHSKTQGRKQELANNKNLNNIIQVLRQLPHGLFLYWQRDIFSIITPVFNVTWSFWNHSSMLIWCLRNVCLEIHIFSWSCDQFNAFLLNKSIKKKKKMLTTANFCMCMTYIMIFSR